MRFRHNLVLPTLLQSCCASVPPAGAPTLSALGGRGRGNFLRLLVDMLLIHDPCGLRGAEMTGFAFIWERNNRGTAFRSVSLSFGHFIFK